MFPAAQNNSKLGTNSSILLFCFKIHTHGDLSYIWRGFEFSTGKCCKNYNKKVLTIVKLFDIMEV